MKAICIALVVALCSCSGRTYQSMGGYKYGDLPGATFPRKTKIIKPIVTCLAVAVIITIHAANDKDK